MTTKNSFGALLLLLFLPVAGLGQIAQEYAIKATYIARFTEFIEWPEEAGEDDNSRAIVLSVIGDAPFRDVFDHTFAALTIKNRSVEVRYISSVEECEGSWILFVSRSERKKLGQILAFTKDKPVLTVSDTEGFAGKGVIINFYPEHRTLKFEINSSAIGSTGLRMSSLLLNHARIVDPENGEQR